MNRKTCDKLMFLVERDILVEQSVIEKEKLEARKILNPIEKIYWLRKVRKEEARLEGMKCIQENLEHYCKN